jgi:hypothetical protein
LQLSKYLVKPSISGWIAQLISGLFSFLSAIYVVLNYDNNTSTIWLSLSIIITINTKFSSCYLIVLLRQISSKTSNFTTYDNIHQYIKSKARKKALFDIIVPEKSKYLQISFFFSLLLSLIFLTVLLSNLVDQKFQFLALNFLFASVILFSNSVKMFCITLLTAFEKVAFCNYLNSIHSVIIFCILFAVCNYHGSLLEIITSIMFLNLLLMTFFAYKIKHDIDLRILRNISFNRIKLRHSKELTEPVIKNTISSLSYLSIIQGSGILFSIFSNSEASSFYLLCIKAFDAINKFAYIPISTRLQFITRCIKCSSYEVLNSFLYPRFILNNVLIIIGFSFFYFIIQYFKQSEINISEFDLVQIIILFIFLSFVTKTYAIVLMLQNSLNKMLYYKNYIYALVLFSVFFILYLDAMSIVFLISLKIISFIVAFRFNIILNTCRNFKISTFRLFSIQLVATPLLLLIYVFYVPKI